MSKIINIDTTYLYAYPIDNTNDHSGSESTQLVLLEYFYGYGGVHFIC
jgi:hypothetical protein